MIELLFWIAVGVLAWTYVGFPLVVLVRGRLMPRPYRREDINPPLSVIVACHNEEQGIGDKLANLLGCDYPADRVEVIVVSDGSTDGTERIVRGFEPRGVRLVALPRQGKAPALNAGVAQATGEILVFSDANSEFVPQALRALTRSFADPAIGAVAGDQRYRRQGASGAAASGERSYWSFDRLLKQAQSRAGNTISATGSIYAMRRSLFVEVPEGVTDDFVTSTRVIAQGRRLVFEPEAISREPVAAKARAELRRKVRVITRGLRALWTMRELLNPFRFGFYSIQLFSHKLLRRMAFLPLAVTAVTAPLLWDAGPLYVAATVGQASFYAAALAGLLLSRTRFGRFKAIALPFYFCMVNWACVMATANVLRGERIRLWEPERADPVGPTETESHGSSVG